MNEDFAPFELAVKLKEKGFREKCLYRYRNYSKTLQPNRIQTKFAREIDYSEFFKCYNLYEDNDIDAPTISQVLKWLREEKKIYVEIFLYDGKYSYLVKDITRICDDLFHKCLNEDTDDEEYATYEQAALAGIEYVLDNLI